MQVEEQINQQQTQPQQSNKIRLFDVSSKEEKEQLEQHYLSQLEQLQQARYAEGASEKMKHYLENKKILDNNIYYESKYKPLDNDVSSSDEAYQKLMNQANIYEYGSNFNTNVYDPKNIVQNQDELLDNILKRSVKSSLNTLIKTPNQSQIGGASVGVAAGLTLPLLTGPAAIAARFTGYSTTVKTFIPPNLPKQ